MRNSRLINRFALRDTLATLLMSTSLALIVWVFAVDQENPSLRDTFSAPIPLQIVGPENYLQTIQNLSDRTVSVDIRAPRRTWDGLTVGDFNAVVDLTGLGPGTHDVLINLTLFNSEVDIIDMQPKVLRVQIEAVTAKEVAAEVDVIGIPESLYEVSTLVIEPMSVTVSGPASLVDMVTRTRSEVLLTDEDGTFQADFLTLSPVNRQDQPIPQILVVPKTISVTISLRPK
jgi:YbbR domain-containing protein